MTDKTNFRLSEMARRPGVHPVVLQETFETSPRTVAERLVQPEIVWHVVLRPRHECLLEDLAVEVRSAGPAQRLRRGARVAWGTQRKRQRAARRATRIESVTVGFFEQLTVICAVCREHHFSPSCVRRRLVSGKG